MSNIRWDANSWGKVNPRHFCKVVHNPAKFFSSQVDLILVRKGEWKLYVNGNYIASFNTWDEASQAAPMLYQLHKG